MIMSQFPYITYLQAVAVLSFHSYTDCFMQCALTALCSVIFLFVLGEPYLPLPSQLNLVLIYRARIFGFHIVQCH